MPGPVLTIASAVTCAHAGIGRAANPSPQVSINGSAAVMLATAYAVAGCQFPVMTTGAPPCVAAQFSLGPSTCVFTNNSPLLVAGSNGTSLPNGTPLIVVPEQTQVIAK